MQKRQGDIFFETVKRPSIQKMKSYENNILAYGEVTGHSHKIVSPAFSECESYVDEKGDIYIMSKTEPITIEHDEHSSITMPANEWICVTRQREYDPLTILRERKVAD
jgi:hypothetical protein